MPERNFLIGIVQMSCTPEPEQNLERAIAHVRDAAAKSAEIVCLPELFQTQYFCQREDVALFDLAEPIPGPATQRLGEVARELKITIIASLFERRAPGIYHNTAAIIDREGKLQGIYRKMHIPDDPLYYEKFYFAPGDLGFKTFATDFRQVRHAGVLGPVVSRGRAPDRAAGRERALLSHGDRLASRRKGGNTARRSTTRGAPFSARTPSPMEFMSRSRIASVSRLATFAANRRRAKVWSSGADRSSPIPSDRSSRRPRTTRKRF